jgi:protein-L-isoaspartate(D-aspartate) O-methyltransferase
MGHVEQQSRPRRLRSLWLALVAALAAAPAPLLPPQEDRRVTAAQGAMLEEIRRDAYETRGYTGRAELGAGVMAALGRVPRHRFVEAAPATAYANRPLPIGHRPTI